MKVSSSNANDKDITNEKNRESKTKITIHDNPSDKRKVSVHVEEVAVNEPGGNSLTVSEQVSNSQAFFSESIPKDTNNRNLKSI